MDDLSGIQRFTVWVLPVLFAITVHEVAHGWVALRLGDRTAQMMGRLTLNPIKHIDPVGTVLVPGFLLLMGGFVFGWAKPVPVTWENLRNPRRDVALVAVAGPAANLLMAILWSIILKIGLLLSTTTDSWAYPLVLMGNAGILINLVLMVLNLLPILPLDGGRILSAFLPPPMAYKLSRLEPWGFFIILGLFFLGLLSMVINPAVQTLHAIMLRTISL